MAKYLWYSDDHRRSLGLGSKESKAFFEQVHQGKQVGRRQVVIAKGEEEGSLSSFLIIFSFFSRIEKKSFFFSTRNPLGQTPSSLLHHSWTRRIRISRRSIGGISDYTSTTWYHNCCLPSANWKKELKNVSLIFWERKKFFFFFSKKVCWSSCACMGLIRSRYLRTISQSWLYLAIKISPFFK